MPGTVTLPVWIIFIAGIMVVWTILYHFLIPGIRWFFKKREKKALCEIKERLNIQLPPFKLIKRKVLVDRLISDPDVLEAVEVYSREQGVSNEVILEKVKCYAREIVPAFSVYLYFRIGNFLSKTLVRSLYRVRLGYADEKNVEKINANASVVFLMNHRSNMDYILLAYFVLRRAALSFAVGEWARVWPLQQLIRAMGAYFVRRGSGDTLYRRVLARYVQMATEGGVVQAVFPEGGLSRDGRMRQPRIGLLDYMLRNFDPEGKRDLVFIPAAVNYDRVFEDRTVLLDANPEGDKRPRKNPLTTTLTFLFKNIWLMMSGGWYRFGYAAVNFGTPVSMREYTRVNKIDFRKLDRKTRIERVQHLACELLDAVGKVIPVLPVALISYVFAENPDRHFTELELKARVQNLIRQLERYGAHVYIPRKDRSYAINVGLRMLTLRHLVLEEDEIYRAAPGEAAMLRYYANSISHFIE